MQSRKGQLRMLETAPLSYSTSHRKKALILSIIPGLGQLYNKQIFKGIAFLVLSAAFIYVFGNLLNMGLWGLVTLGTEYPVIIRFIF